jgi:hypothetical protein
VEVAHVRVMAFHCFVAPYQAIPKAFVRDLSLRYVAVLKSSAHRDSGKFASDSMAIKEIRGTCYGMAVHGWWKCSLIEKGVVV